MELQDALNEAEKLGVTIEWVALPAAMAGAYNHAERTIYLAKALPDSHVLPTLLHELEHAKAGHDGHQPPRVEARIDETVAEQLITPDAYARAEALTDGRTPGIAVELGLPRWVVSAYRRRLWRTPQITSC